MTPGKYRAGLARAERAKTDEAERVFRANAKKIAEQERKIIQSEWDDKAYQDPSTAYVQASEQDAYTFNLCAVEDFIAATPGYYKDPEGKNAHTMMSYLSKNTPNTNLLTVATLTAAFRRLDEYGLLIRRPVPPPPVKVKIGIEYPPETVPTIKPELYEGWDAEGNPRTYTKFEVDRMSGDEMKRRLRLTPSRLTLPNRAAF